MSAEQLMYNEAGMLMQPSDVIAFGGKWNFSEIIKFATFSDFSHVGVVLQTKISDDDTGRFFNQIIESQEKTRVRYRVREKCQNAHARY